ncbi:Yip1 family protein [Sulfitobacter sp. JB4-11]|uniref:Yip1 family protein n=1 Tax=Sulfitobacter rhodophyticola TaxID=3238304 RepID=UPI003513BD44
MEATLMPLVQTTLRQPRLAAEMIMGLGLKRDVLWTALALGAALHALVLQLVLSVSEPAMPLPGYMSMPLVLFVLIAGVMVIYVHALHWAARALGGKGELWDMLAVIVWLQLLRATAQLILLVVSLAMPLLGMVLALVVGVWGLWILFNFIAAAGRLPTAGHGIAVVVMAAVGLVLGLSIFLSLIGLSAQGVPS